MPLLRLFVAVPLGAAIGAAVARAISTARLTAPSAKWAAPEGVHLTLHFLGGVSSDRVPAIAAALARAAARHQPFAIEAAAAGIFGRASSPRVLWLGVGGDREALAALQRDVAAALAAIGFPSEDREFRPHLTLARARDAGGDARLARAAGRLAAFDAGRTQVTQVELVQSHLGPRGARYSTLAAAPLGGGP